MRRATDATAAAEQCARAGEFLAPSAASMLCLCFAHDRRACRHADDTEAHALLEPVHGAGRSEADGKLQRAEEGEVRWVHVALLAVPAFFDMAATILSLAGLSIIRASVNQLLRSWAIPMTALLAPCVLTLEQRRKGAPARRGRCVSGIAVVVVGLAAVAGAELLNTETNQERPASSGPSAGRIAFGVSLSLTGNAIMALQMLIEERLLKGRDFSPALQNGIEGLYVMVFTFGIAIPAFGAWDDIQQLLVSQPTASMGVSLAVIASLAVFSVAGMTLAKLTSSVARVLVSTTRSVGTWSGGLALYAATNGAYGEQWGSHSWLQVVGCVVVIGGMYLHATSLARSKLKDDKLAATAAIGNAA